MNRLKRAVLWATLIAVMLLMCLSIYGAFLGAERAQAFFNSLPLAVYWLGLAVLLAAGILVFHRLRHVPSLLLMHLGCILVLAGGMWGSQAGHAIQRRLFGFDRIAKGQMAIREHSEDNRVMVADANDTRELPFSVRLKDFRMEYYTPGSLHVHSPDGQSWKLPAEPGAKLRLSDEIGTIAVARVFENFKVSTQDGKRLYYDAPGGSNPALELTLERPDGSSVTGHVFERFPPMFPMAVELSMSYRRTVRDYVSELEIVDDGDVRTAKSIEVNRPLHYGGYHFYQHSYGDDGHGEYTVLMVVSDSGLGLVYGGYAMLAAGVFWHFWGRRVLTAIRNRRPVERIPADTQEQHG